MTYQTKRQLREALAQAEERAREERARAESAEARLERVGTNASLYGNSMVAAELDRDHAGSELLKLGYKRIDGYNERLQTPTFRFEAPEELPAAAEARREALKKVLQALEIKDYINGYAGLPNSRAPLAAQHDTDRFWGDIQVALEHREAEEHAEAQKKTAEKVAGLTTQKLEVDVSGAIDASKIRASDEFYANLAESTLKPEDIDPNVVDLSADSIAKIANAIAEATLKGEGE